VVTTCKKGATSRWLAPGHKSVTLYEDRGAPSVSVVWRRIYSKKHVTDRCKFSHVYNVSPPPPHTHTCARKVCGCRLKRSTVCATFTLQTWKMVHQQINRDNVNKSISEKISDIAIRGLILLFMLLTFSVVTLWCWNSCNPWSLASWLVNDEVKR
jgi:hypothetical protein